MTRVRSSTHRCLVAAVSIAAALAAGCGAGAKARGPTVAESQRPANPKAVRLMARAVQASSEKGGLPEAIKLLQEAVALDDALWEARYNLGVLSAKSGDLAGAEKALQKAHKQAPNVAEIALALGEVLGRRGQHREAADVLGNYLKAHPRAVEVRQRYVSALRDAGDIDKAIQQAQEVLTHKAGDAGALSELALCRLAKGEREAASLLVDQAKKADSESAIAERASGLIALATGDDAAAFAAFARAAEHDPTDTTARLNMGAVLMRAGAYQKAQEQYEKILSLNSEDVDAMVGLAAALRGLGDPKKPATYARSRELLERAIKRDPHHLGALFNLGVLYADFLKQPKSAVALFRRFLSEAPSSHPARKSAEEYLGHAKLAAAPAGKS